MVILLLFYSHFRLILSPSRLSQFLKEGKHFYFNIKTFWQLFLSLFLESFELFFGGNKFFSPYYRVFNYSLVPCFFCSLFLSSYAIYYDGETHNNQQTSFNSKWTSNKQGEKLIF